MLAQRLAARAVGLLSCVMLGAFFSSCATTEFYPSSARAAEINFPEDLTAADSSALEGQLTAFTWGPAHYAECNGCAQPHEVRIRAVGKTKDIKANDGPKHRRIVAMIENISNEDVYHTPSGVTFQAHSKYLMWVSRDTATGHATWGMFKLAVGHIPGQIGLLTSCGHEIGSYAIDDANFYNCGDAHVSFSLITKAYAAPTHTRGATAAIVKRTWVSCDPDCCTGT